jgi:hypothetical protein
MPEVIAEYAKEGVNVSEPDSNGYTPIDLTVLNKSYNSMKVLAEIGERPKPELLKTCDSISIKEYFSKLGESKKLKIAKQVIKSFSLVMVLLLCLVSHYSDVTMGLAAISIYWMAHIVIKPHKPERYMDNSRKTEFVSEMCLGKTINMHNHKAYLLLHAFTISCGTYALLHANCANHLQALACLVLFVAIAAYFVHLIAQVYAICVNLTYEELFYPHRYSHLWEKINYIQ